MSSAHVRPSNPRRGIIAPCHIDGSSQRKACVLDVLPRIGVNLILVHSCYRRKCDWWALRTGKPSATQDLTSHPADISDLPALSSISNRSGSLLNSTVEGERSDSGGLSGPTPEWFAIFGCKSWKMLGSGVLQLTSTRESSSHVEVRSQHIRLLGRKSK